MRVQVIMRYCKVRQIFILKLISSTYAGIYGYDTATNRGSNYFSYQVKKWESNFKYKSGNDFI